MEGQFKNKIEKFQRSREEICRVYKILDRELFNYKPPKKIFRPWEERGTAKKLSLEEMFQAINLAIGEQIGVLNQSEEEIIDLVNLIYDVGYTGIDSPSIKKKTMKNGKVKYYMKFERSGCFISTACVEVAGLPDNCDQLQILREFRDGYVANLPKGSGLIKSYYDFAPRIVSGIQIRPDSKDIFSRIFENDVLKVVNTIERGDYDVALNHYQKIVTKLKRENLSLLS